MNRVITEITLGMSLRRLAVLTAAVLAAIVLAAISAASAKAEFGFESVDGESIANEAGAPAVLAGSHPWSSNATLNFNVENQIINGEEYEVPEGQFNNILTILPPGQVGTSLATPRCSIPDFANPPAYAPLDCPNNTAVGWAKVKPNWVPYYLYGPVYNLEPSFGEPALFGFRIASATIYIHARVRSGANAGVTLESKESSQGLPITDTQVTLWGVPADPSHDKNRGRCLERFGETGDLCPSNAAPRPLINYPTACSEPLKTTIQMDSWANPGIWVEDSFLSHGADGIPAGVERCEELGFEPKMNFAMQPSTAASPGSLDVTMSVPQNDSPDGRVTAHLKKVVATLPEGVTLNSGSADGLGFCTEAQIKLEEGVPAECPASSRIGTVRVNTPLLEDELGGSLFLAQQNKNPFNSLVALYLAIENPKNGVYVKTAGKVDLDPVTGRLTTTFDGQPQLPFNELELSFAGGPRAALATPSACGTYSTTYSMTSWSGKTVNGKSQVTVNQNCGKDAQFTPGFAAGTTNPVGGEFSPFTMRVTREDGQQNLGGIDITMPEGLSAKLAGVPLCPDAQAATGNCPAASQIGTTTVASGVGSNPVYVPQPGKAPTAIYLAGPYKGGPYSLVVKVPAQAGPFDLGVVSVRSAIYVDPATAQVTVKSDPLPQMLQGVPVTYRDVRVDVNRPEFTINPTSCDPMAVNGVLSSAKGAVANVSSRFQVTDCANLGFKPKLKLSLAGQMKRSGNPALKAVMTQPPGGANIDQVQVILPKTAFIDNAHINNPCTRAQYAAEACPAKSVLGTVEAKTPLLDEPLRGKVYFRANGGERELPDIVAALRGQIAVDLVGYIDSVQNRKQGTSRDEAQGRQGRADRKQRQPLQGQAQQGDGEDGRAERAGVRHRTGDLQGLRQEEQPEEVTAR
jgi:hypothetical protein